MPKISVIVVNFNGEKFLQNCLSSILKNDYPNFEVIFVDNNSGDKSVELVRKLFPKVKVIESRKNLGYAGGTNLGCRKAVGDYFLIINNDTSVEKSFLKNLFGAFAEIPHLGCVQPKIVTMENPRELDSCGSFLTDSLFLYHYGYRKNEKLAKYNRPFPVFSVKGVAMMVSRKAVKEIGMFDEDFWCYYEETDFCHRCWLAGWECWYYPKALVYHAAGGTSLVYFKNDFIQFQNFKNKMVSFLKNFEALTLMRTVPVYLLVNILLSFFWLFSGKVGHFFSLYRASTWNLTHLSETLKKRRKIQSLRQKSDWDIFSKLKVKVGFGYYYWLFRDLKYFQDRPINEEQLPSLF